MKKILIANRGEIACRVIRTAKKMGIATVAVYSDIDRNAPHVLMADEAIHIGPNPSSQSYLDQDKIVEAAKATSTDGIHPGYGFLSENSSFSERLKKEGITFIGPSPEAIDIMGSKLAAKDAVKKFDIPMVPGTDYAIENVDEAIKTAKEIGFPILIKASAGGGGKGMRIVENESEVEEQMKRAISEAESSFGDGSVFIEKYIRSPRHIEIQVLADNHGNVVHLFERECSIQRRHQKVVEEAPSVVLSEELRQKMGQAAINVAKSVDYSGAGTVEFLLDENHNFYFLEMNTRLQVEHPITELVTGVDLVEQQIRVARNEKLSLTQKFLYLKGHAIELRVYAEDPMNNFLPSVGRLEEYQIPEMENVRVDHGYRENMDIPIFYDPMIAKLISYGSTRSEAISTMKKAIKAYQIDGIHTTLNFGLFVMDHPAFISGDISTHFVKDHFSADLIEKDNDKKARLASQIGLELFLQEKKKLRTRNTHQTNWKNR